MFVQNNAGRLLAQGGMEAARYKMAEGQAYAGMLQQMGGTFSQAIQEQQFKKQKKERDAQAARTLSEMFGMEEKDAMAVSQSVGAENVGNFAVMQERYKQSQFETQRLQQEAEMNENIGVYLEKALNDPNTSAPVRALAVANAKGIPPTPAQFHQALTMKPEQPWQPIVVDLGGGEQAMMTSPSSAQRITPPPPEKPKGISWDDKVTVKPPVDLSNAAAMGFDTRNSVPVSLKEAVELGIPEYVQAYGDKYESEYGYHPATAKFSQQDREAYEWVQENADHAASQKILEELKRKYGNVF